MRWRLLALPVLLLAVQVKTAQAQQDYSVPVTMTMLAASLNHPADSVVFYSVDGERLGSAAEQDSTYQKTVGRLKASPGNGRYVLRADIHQSEGNPREFLFSFGPEDLCFADADPPHTGVIERVACTLEKQGNKIVCEAIYEGLRRRLRCTPRLSVRVPPVHRLPGRGPGVRIEPDVQRAGQLNEASPQHPPRPVPCRARAGPSASRAAQSSMSSRMASFSCHRPGIATAP